MLSDIPDEWGPKFACESGAIAHTHADPHQIAFKSSVHMVLVMFTPQPGREVSLNSDRKVEVFAPMGATEIIPAGSDLFARWKTQKSNLLLAFDPAHLSRIAGLEFDNPDIDFQPPKLGFVDETALFLASRLRDELSAKSAVNPLYADALLTAFEIHALRHYSAGRPRAARQLVGGLTPREWRSVDDYIRAHLHLELSIAQLAVVARRSPGAFIRAFRETSGQTPYQYILELRLTLAERLIKTTEMPFADIAGRAGFWSHSHMAATLKRARGMTPSQLRRGGDPHKGLSVP